MNILELRVEEARPINQVELDSLSIKKSETGQDFKVGDKIIYIYLIKEGVNHFTSVTSDEVGLFEMLDEKQTGRIPIVRMKG